MEDAGRESDPEDPRDQPERELRESRPKESRAKLKTIWTLDSATESLKIFFETKVRSKPTFHQWQAYSTTDHNPQTSQGQHRAQHDRPINIVDKLSSYQEILKHLYSSSVQSQRLCELASILVGTGSPDLMDPSAFWNGLTKYTNR